MGFGDYEFHNRPCDPFLRVKVVELITPLYYFLYPIELLIITIQHQLNKIHPHLIVLLEIFIQMTVRRTPIHLTQQVHYLPTPFLPSHILIKPWHNPLTEPTIHLTLPNLLKRLRHTKHKLQCYLHIPHTHLHRPQRTHQLLRRHPFLVF